MDGLRAVVTGGTRGIGAAVVRRLVELGATVLASARNPVDDLPEGVLFAQGDLSTSAAAQELAEQALDELGCVDVLVNNAGGGFAPGGWLELSDDDWLDAVQTNFLGAVRLDRALVPQMVERGCGAVVHITSTIAVEPAVATPHYSAAKAALSAYSKALSNAVAANNVRVNRVSPAWVATSSFEAVVRGVMQTRGLDEQAARASLVEQVGQAPMGRTGKPKETADLVSFLVSNRASFITGSEFVIDGGLLRKA